MIRLAVTTTITTRTAGMVWFPFEVSDATSMDEIYQRLMTDRMVYGEKLETTVRDSKRIIRGRIPTIVAIGGVATITPLHLVLSELHELPGQS